MHAVCMHSAKIVHAFGVNMGSHPVVCEQGWDPHTRLLICGNIDGFARIMYVAGGPAKAKQCMHEAARVGERGGVVNVKHTWRAHTAMITQCKFVAQRGSEPACFCTGAADGSVKLWTLKGELIRQLGMTGTDKIVKLVSKKLVRMTVRSKASISKNRSVDVRNTVLSGVPDGPNTAGMRKKIDRGTLTRSESAHAGLKANSVSGFGVGKTIAQVMEAKQKLASEEAMGEEELWPAPPPGAPARRKAGRIAKMMVYVENGEQDIKDIGKMYRAQAFDRAHACDVRRGLAVEEERREAEREEAVLRLKEGQDGDSASDAGSGPAVILSGHGQGTEPGSET